MNKILLIAILLVASFCEVFAGITASIAQGSRNVFYVGEWAYVSVEVREFDNSYGTGNSNYVIRNLSGNAQWLTFVHRHNYANGTELHTEQPYYHWQNNQRIWIELSGKATQPGTYSGRLSVSHTNDITGATEVAYLNYSFEVRDYNRNLAVLSQDYAASYDRQIEFRSYMVNRSNSSITLNNPYMDYYMTKSAEKQVILNVWKKPENSCVQVLDCGNGHFVVRQHVMGSKVLNAGWANSDDDFQLGINEIGTWNDRYYYTYLPEKYADVYDANYIDYSYNGYSTSYSTRASHRNWFYNDHMTIAANGGVRYYGNSPNWYSEGSCHAARLTTSTAYQENKVRTSDESVFCQNGPSQYNSSSSSSLVARFMVNTQANVNEIKMNFDVKNKSNQRVSLSGYEIWFYFNDENASKLAQAVFEMYNPRDGSISQQIKKCAEKEYVLKLHFGNNSSVGANQSYPNDAIQGNLHAADWQYIYNKQNFASWNNFYTLTENPKMALFDNQGRLVYGKIQWSCGEKPQSSSSSVSRSSSSSIRSSSSSSIPRSSSSSIHSSSSSSISSNTSQNLVARFMVNTQANVNEIKMNFDVKNKSNQRVSLSGYEIWFYFNDENASKLAQAVFEMYNPRDGSISQQIKKCAEKEYVLKLHFGNNSSVGANQSYPNDAIQGNLHAADWQYIYNKQNFASWNNFYTLTENPKMALFDNQGRLVYGKIQWSCGEKPQSSSSSVSRSSSSSIRSSSSSSIPRSSSSSIHSSSSSSFPFNTLLVRFSDVSQNSGANAFDMQFDIVNMGDMAVSLDGYEMLFYYNDAGKPFMPEFKSIDLGGAVLENGYPRAERCAVDKYAIRYKFASSAIILPYGLYPDVTKKIKAELKDSTYFDKTKFASWLPVYGGSMAENPNMALFDKSGTLVYGMPAWPCEGYSEKSLKLLVEGRVGYENVKVDGISNKIQDAVAKVSVKIENKGDSVVSGPVYVDFYVSHTAGHVPMIVFTPDTLSVAGRVMVVDEDVAVVRMSAGNKHTFRLILLNGIGAASSGKVFSREIIFELMDQCLFGCEEKEEAVAYKWDLSDDWSAYGLGGSFAITNRVTIYNSENTLLYGESDPSTPVYAVNNNGDLVQPKANIGPQLPNRTDVVAYSGGQLLSGGDFETPWMQGWNVNGVLNSTPEVRSVRAQSPQGSRHLFLGNLTSVSQNLSEAATQVLLDSGAVLTVWHKGGEAAVKINGTHVRTLDSSRKFWTVDTIPLGDSLFNSTSYSVLSITTADDTICIDDAVLVPSRTTHPTTYATRFTNTFGEEIETRAYDGADEQLITTSERDRMGRMWKKYLPFAMPCNGVVACNSDVRTLNNPGMAKSFYTTSRPDYPDAGNVPYAETAWKPDPMATMDVVGAPGVNFGVANGHVVRAYSSGVNMSGIDMLDSVSLDSVVAAVSENRSYDGLINYHAVRDTNPTHLWELNVDQDGRMAFTVKDGEKRIIVSGALDAADGHLLTRSVNELDERGNVVKVHPPMSCGYKNAPANCVNPSTYEYDSQSRVVKSREPDAGETRTYYDLAGRVRASQTKRQIDSGWVSVVGYDQLDRVIYTGKWETSLDEDALREYFNNVDNKNSPSVDELTPGTVTRTFYDRMPARDTLGVELYPPSAIVPAPTYTLGRVAAVVSDVRAVLDANGSAVQASDGSDSVIRVSTANSYDKYGRVLSSYAFDPTVPASADSLRMLWSDTKYDLGGKVVSTTRNSYGLSFAGIVFRSVTERYTYDRLGRVDNIYSSQGYGNAPLAHYEYYPTGSVKSVNLGNSLTLAYTYHISGAVKTATVTSIGGDQLYSETLNYEDCGNGECTPQYNGNISRMAHQLAHGNTAYSENRNVTYYYDQLNRLASAEDIVENAFDEMFEYDAQGRIVSQRRAGNTSNTSGGEYAYESGSNRLKSVAAGMGGTAGSRDMSDADNFVYDQDGNLVEDKSKSLTISYDWRDLPVEFTRETCTDYSGYVFCDSTKLIMAYDGAGRRISKTRMKKTAFDGPWYASLVTHYTGIGTEIRENPVNHETKVVMNMPQGLGRYEIEDALVPVSSSTSGTFEWYIKNHLGSNMLVYATGRGTSGSMLAAYDYRAFGEQVSLVEPADKVTENFTGKERDDETLLSYHGARYLDPMLGVWISVDPKRFFSSPYLYMGNGYNPILFFDLNGMKPGDPFGSSLEAAQDFARLYNGASIASNREYGTVIYRKGDSYSYLKPTRGSDGEVGITEMATNARLSGYSVVTSAHTHSRITDENGVVQMGFLVPSSDDYQGDFNDPTFTPYKEDPDEPAYLVNPAGQLIEYGSDQEIYPIPTEGIASDPYFQYNVEF